MCIFRELLARQIRSSIHPSIHLSTILLTYLLIRLFALFSLLWLGSGTGHRSHTSTTTLFQYPRRNFLGLTYDSVQLDRVEPALYTYLTRSRVITRVRHISPSWAVHETVQSDHICVVDMLLTKKGRFTIGKFRYIWLEIYTANVPNFIIPLLFLKSVFICI